VAERDVVDVKELLLAALAVPDLSAYILRVRKDRPHSTLGPGNS
jgi:hypothetical protein